MNISKKSGGPLAQCKVESIRDRQFVNALARGLDLLRCFDSGDRYMGITELARRTGIPKPTVSRLAGTLNKLGYLNFSSVLGKYSLGTAVLALGHAKLSTIDIRSIARPLMEELAEYSRISVSLGMRDRLDMVYVETVRSSAPISLQRGIGARLSMATTSMGRAYIAGTTEEERNEILENIRASYKNEWPKIKAGIEQGISDYAEYGFCISLGEWTKEIWAVGVPYKNAEGELLAFNCGGPAFMLKKEQLKKDIGPRLVEMVKQLTFPKSSNC
jgi:DNA-binding IclR family transcriptional regulator